MATTTQPSASFLAESRQPLLLGVYSMFIVAQVVVLALRAFTKWKYKITWKLDDLFILLAFVFNMGVVACALIDVVQAGVGRHLAYVLATDPGMLTILGKMQLAGLVLYLAAVLLPKLAIVTLYLSIFTQPLFRAICWITTAVMVTNWLVTTIIAFRTCVPLELLWDQTLDGYCLDQNSFYRWISFPNIITDLVLIVAPVPYIWQIQLPKALRLGVTFTFMLGGLGLVASIARFIGFFNGDVKDDATWSAADLYVWTVAEPSIYLIAACLPGFRPLFRAMFNKVRGTRTTPSAGDSQGLRGQNPSHQRSDIYRDKKGEWMKLQDVQKGNISTAGSRTHSRQVGEVGGIMVTHSHEVEFDDRSR